MATTVIPANAKPKQMPARRYKLDFDTEFCPKFESSASSSSDNGQKFAAHLLKSIFDLLTVSSTPLDNIVDDKRFPHI